jgi:hypothetical protein
MRKTSGSLAGGGIVGLLFIAWLFWHTWPFYLLIFLLVTAGWGVFFTIRAIVRGIVWMRRKS